ncbi:hypothetical protein PGQ11_005240 [Apiospora arundinis]|uniref:Uncharacterized protein n=1 Tax=Apiospora arundinis TaxID=335852 RepID=A0ABR2JAB8_9PEZI
MSNSLTVAIAALTTVFTHSCSQSWLLTTTRAPSQFPPFPTGGPASCEPPSWKDNIAAQGIRFYSPAICPSGFFVGPNCGVTKTRTQEGFAPVTSGETVAYCVPSDHTCTTDTTDFRGGVWGFATATEAGSQITVAPAIQIRWRESDLSILQTHPLTPGLLLVGDRSLPTSTSVPAASPTDTSMRFTTLVPAPSVTGSPPPAQSAPATNAPPAPTTNQPGSTSKNDKAATSQSPSLCSSVPSGGCVGGGSPFSTPGRPDTQQGSQAAIVLAATFTSLAVVSFALFTLIRYVRERRRRHHPEEDQHLTPIGVGVWARYGQKAGSWGFMLRRKSERRIYEKQRDDMEAGRGRRGRVSAVTETIVEVDGAPPLGTRGNPAELDAASARNIARWSWVSRISEAVGGRKSTRTPSRTGSSRQSESRPSRRSSSKWTSSIFVGRTSADWEAFAKERWPNGLTVPPQSYPGGSDKYTTNTNKQKRSSGMTRSLSRRPSLSPPSTSYTANTVTATNANANANSNANLAAAKGHTRNKSSQFRLSERSDGTFGEMPRSPGFGFPPSPTSPVSRTWSPTSSGRFS